jgi:hypothetical protein
MAELSRGLGFSQEARSDLAAEAKLRREYLDRHHALEPTVGSAIHYPHPAAAKLVIELVIRG